jgi:hypothetical protein
LLSDFCFVLFLLILSLVYSMLPVYLDCPFFIAPSVFFNFYIVQRVTLGMSISK